MQPSLIQAQIYGVRKAAVSNCALRTSHKHSTHGKLHPVTTANLQLASVGFQFPMRTFLVNHQWSSFFSLNTEADKKSHRWQSWNRNHRPRDKWQREHLPWWLSATADSAERVGGECLSFGYWKLTLCGTSQCPWGNGVFFIFHSPPSEEHHSACPAAERQMCVISGGG